ncbi:MAG: GlsB/YeaQ/YmgE family stress response membrane protein [Ignavibacteriales bacterium]|nr:GlsB/YeaQ/YmgE family stress response membrane protein [Ignavibacteriales bacterium]
MEIIGTLLVGLIAGVIAKLLMPGKDPGGCIITILLGIAGAFVATYLGKLLGVYEPGDTAGFIGATIGAIIILWLYRIILKKKVRS